MAPITTIDGIQRDPRYESMGISSTLNGHSTASIALIVDNAEFRVQESEEFIFEHNGTRLFGGLTERIIETSFFDGSTDLLLEVSCTDFNGYASRRIVNSARPAETLKARLSFFVSTYLAVFGVTLHAGQVDGPTLPAIEFKNENLTAALNRTMAMTAEVGVAYAWRIDYFKVFRASQPGVNVAPFDVTDATEEAILHDLKIEEARNNNYANRVFVDVVAQKDDNHVETFTGDGTSGPFELEWTLTQGQGIIHLLLLDGITAAGGETFGIKDVHFDDDGNPTQWWYDPATNTITKNDGVTQTDRIYSLRFGATFAPEIIEELPEATTDPEERVIKVDEIMDEAGYRAVAAAYLAKNSKVIKTATYETLEEGLEVGQQQTINSTKRAVNAVGIITDIDFSQYDADTLLKRVTVVIDPSLTNLDRNWRDVYRQWADTGKGGAATTPTTTTPVTSLAPAPPEESVQYHRPGGGFGGKGTFKFREAQNSLIVGGGGSDITATNYESCFVFGYNCHITDPS